MNSRSLLLLLFLSVIVAFVSARATTFLAILAPLRNVKSSNLGIGFASLSLFNTNGNVTSNTNQFRFRYEVAYNGDTITSVSLLSQGKVIQTTTFFVSGYPYVYQDVIFLTGATFKSLEQDQFTVIVHTNKYPAGAVSGTFQLALGLGFGWLNGAQEVPPTKSTAKGFAISYLTDQKGFQSANISQFYPQLYQNLLQNTFILHNVNNPTKITLNGPALPGRTGSVVATFPTKSSYTSVSFHVHSGLMVHNFLRNLEYVNIASNSFKSGEIRSQIYPAIEARRREPIASVTVNSGVISGELASTFRKTKGSFGEHHNPNASLRLVPDPTTNLFNAVFSFQIPVIPAESWIVRGLALQVNLFGDGDTWNFEWFNFANQSWVLAGTFSALPIGYQYGGAILTDAPEIINYLSPSNQVLVRIRNLNTLNSGRFLTVDQFTVQPYLPAEISNEFIRSIIHTFFQA